jgi:hypothetical protein
MDGRRDSTKHRARSIVRFWRFATGTGPSPLLIGLTRDTLTRVKLLDLDPLILCPVSCRCILLYRSSRLAAENQLVLTSCADQIGTLCML